MKGSPVLALVVEAAVVIVALAGCRERSASFVELPDARIADAPSAEAASGDAMASPDRSAERDTAGGDGPCVPRAETCNLVDDDCNGTTDDTLPAVVASDLLNCGKCGRICAPDNAIPACVMGACTVKECQPGAFDADGKPENGCECARTDGGVESCDQMDNDCDGMTDEDFDFKVDVNNCARCGMRCAYPFAKPECNNGTCQMGACLAGFYDRNMRADDGCEMACLMSAGGMEICDGQDNDCDGATDEAPLSPPSTFSCKTAGVCAGVSPVCMGAMGWTCNYGAAYQDVETMAMGCDGKDNDCDGRTDEAFGIGGACPVGSGDCINLAGAWVCDAGAPGQRRCAGSPKPPGTEICNGLDDDCDGKTDEIDKVSDRTADDVLVYFAGRNVTMFAHEASRYDAPAGGTSGTPAAADAGFDSSRRPCSVPGKLPWSNVTKEEAAAACGKVGVGWRLCTKDEWEDACNGGANTSFPYGGTYVASRCNGYEYVKSAPLSATVPTGAAAQCLSDLGGGAGVLYDMSGNVKEWVTDGSQFQIRGGSYNVASFTSGSPPVTTAPGLQCDAATQAPTVAVRLPSVGFRCCRTGSLPP